MSEKKQMDIVLNIVRNHQPVRTEQVKIMAMSAGCSCADRYLRWLQQDHLVVSQKHPKNRTKTWTAVPASQLPPVVEADKTGQLVMGGAQ